MRIAVVGSSGGMGSFFVRYFCSKGHQVVCSDPVRLAHARAVNARSNAEAASGSDAVLLAVPIWKTVEVAREVSPHMEGGAILVEISSLKEPLLPQLELLSSESGISLLSVHPLFGPSLRKTKGMKLAVIRRRGAVQLTRKLFPDAELLPMTAASHDRAMSVFLSMTHVANLAYAAASARTIGPREFSTHATPAASLQITLAKSVISQDPRLYSYILFENRHTRKALADLSIEVARVERMLAMGDRNGFENMFERLRRVYGRGGDSVRKVYEALGF